jgi:hypothetical protein
MTMSTAQLVSIPTGGHCVKGGVGTADAVLAKANALLTTIAVTASRSHFVRLIFFSSCS